MPVKKEGVFKEESNAPKKSKRAKKVEKTENVITTEDIKTVNQPVVAPKIKSRYSCGCLYVEIGDGRVKEKCVQHGVA